MMRKLTRIGAAAVGVAAVVAAGRLAWEVQSAMGASRARIRPYAAGSPNYRGGAFANTEPAAPLAAGQAPGLLRALLKRGGTGTPSRPIPLAAPLAPAKAADLAATWLGHATVLVEIEGVRLLADPVWSNRVSPTQRFGPARMHAMPTAISALPKVDAVVISHDHYDHLDQWTIRQLADRQPALLFLVPLGVGSHLRSWGVPDERVVELDWNRGVTVGGVTVTCTPARHFSGRAIVRNPTLWASWVFAGQDKRVFFGGDSGYSERFADIGTQYGPFDLALLPVGAYAPQWPDIHMTPEEAVRAHTDLQGGQPGGLLLPIHWATFNLALHPWGEPVARLLAAAQEAGVPVRVPMPGQRVDPAAGPEADEWWVSRA